MGEVINFARPPKGKVIETLVESITVTLARHAISGASAVNFDNGDGPELDAICMLICAAVDIAMDSDDETRIRAAEWLGGVTDRLIQELEGS